jgi:hypothetical protein
MRSARFAEYALSMPAWIVSILLPMCLTAIIAFAAVARTSSGHRRAAFYAVAILVGALSVLGLVYMENEGTWPGGWALSLVSMAVSLLALYVAGRRIGRKTDIPPA